MPSPYTNYSDSEDIYNKKMGREVAEEEVQDNLEDIDDSEDILALDPEDESNFSEEFDKESDDEFDDDFDKESDDDSEGGERDEWEQDWGGHYDAYDSPEY